MKARESCEFSVNGKQWIQYEFMDERIVIAIWDIHPSTWHWIKPTAGRYKLSGSCPKDMTLIPVESEAVCGAV